MDPETIDDRNYSFYFVDNLKIPHLILTSPPYLPIPSTPIHSYNLYIIPCIIVESANGVQKN